MRAAGVVALWALTSELGKAWLTDRRQANTRTMYARADVGASTPRVFAVTDAALVKAGVVGEVTTALAALPHEVFTGGQPEPSLDLAEQCVGQARAYRPDVILGLGGGSNMDLAKVAAAC